MSNQIWWNEKTIFYFLYELKVFFEILRSSSYKERERERERERRKRRDYINIEIYRTLSKIDSPDGCVWGCEGSEGTMNLEK